MPKGKKAGAKKGGAAAKRKIGCCKMTEDAYPLLQCHGCKQWSHIGCLGLPLNTDVNTIDSFTCRSCTPGKKAYKIVLKAPQPDVEKTPQPDAEKTPQPDVEKAPQPDVEQTSQPDVEQTPQPDEEKAPQPDVEQTPQPDVEQTPQPEADAAFEEPKSDEAGGSSKNEATANKNALNWPEETPRSSRPGSFGRKKRSGAASRAGDEAELPEKKSRPTRLNKVTLVSHITDSVKPPAKNASDGAQAVDTEDDELPPEPDNTDKNKHEAELLLEGDKKPEKEGSLEVTVVAQNTEVVSELVVLSGPPSISGSNASEDPAESARKTYEQLVDANEELLSAVGHPSTPSTSAAP
ncbi:SPANX N member 3 [Aphelenchoides avenae]|nr:SPANX N member 3 [Aphelenchus avenae]